MVNEQNDQFSILSKSQRSHVIKIKHNERKKQKSKTQRGK
jgi:hypothetical protein